MAENLKPLTSLRFFAALWVVLFSWWPKLAIEGHPAVFQKGYLGVDLFFVLSGFILCHVYLKQAGERRFKYGSFLWNRLARVYPMHLATLVGLAALGLGAGMMGMSIDPNVMSWKTLWAQLTMTHAWGFIDVAAWNHPSWSISAEWFAYLSFPAFALVAWRMRERPVLAIVLAAGSALAIYAVFQPLAGFSLTKATFLWGALRIVPCFILGCALYLVHRRWTLPHAGWIAGASAAGMVIAASLNAWDPIIVLLAGGLILALGSVQNAGGGLMASPVGVYLGEISYSIYMVNAPVLLVGVNVAGRLTGADDRLHVVVWLGVVALIPVVAAGTYHLVERPARKALRGFADRRAVRAAATKAHTDSPERVLQPSETIV